MRQVCGVLQGQGREAWMSEPGWPLAHCLSSLDLRSLICDGTVWTGSPKDEETLLSSSTEAPPEGVSKPGALVWFH